MKLNQGIKGTWLMGLALVVALLLPKIAFSLSMKLNQGIKGTWLMGLALVVALLLPKIAFSLGFGEIRLYSYLNEPLDAEIELLGAEDVDLSQVLITLASTEDFKKVQLARPYFLTRLRFTLIMHDDREFIHVTTEENVKQPFLEFLVVLSWPDGRLVRGYTVLLDPPPLNRSRAEINNRKALRYFAAKNSKNLNLSKSSTVANNTYGNSESHSDSDDAVNEAAVADLQLKNFRNFENLFQPLEEEGHPIVQDEPIVRSKPKEGSKPKTETVSLAPSISSLVASRELAEPPMVSKPTASSPATSPLIVTTSDNKLLWGSGFALLFVVGLSAWVFRQRQDPLPLRISNNRPLSKIKTESFDDEMHIKLTLAKEYFMINDKESAGEILDDVVSRGNIQDQEAARELLKKI